MNNKYIKFVMSDNMNLSCNNCVSSLELSFEFCCFFGLLFNMLVLIWALDFFCIFFDLMCLYVCLLLCLFFFFVNESEYKNFKIYFKNILFFIIICFIFLCLILVLYNIIFFFLVFFYDILVFFYNIFDFLFSDFDCHCQSDGEEDDNSSGEEGELTTNEMRVIEMQEKCIKETNMNIVNMLEEKFKIKKDLENLLKLEKESLSVDNLSMADACSKRMNVLEVYISNCDNLLSLEGKKSDDMENFIKEFVSNSSSSSSSW